MTHDETAQKIQALSAQLKRRMDKAEETRAELCTVLCEAATLAKNAGVVSDEIHTQVIAPK
jgi:ribosomal protein L1